MALIPCAPASAQTSAPEIRMHENNRVPACVTPDRLMRYLMTRNPDLLPQFRDIARFYKQHGEALRVRWDYAFFQMLIETNYPHLQDRSGWGDVNPKQNNFAGIGTTGGGVPGDSFRTFRPACSARCSISSPTRAKWSTARWRSARARNRTTSSACRDP